MSETPRSYTIYGRKAALCVHADRNSNGNPTLGLDAAFRLGEGRYDWKNKLYIQLTLHELPIFCCVLLGYAPQCVFDRRGGSGKGFAVERQDGRLFFRVWQGRGLQYQVQAGPSDVFHLSALALWRCQVLLDVDTSAILASLRACAKLLDSH